MDLLTAFFFVWFVGMIPATFVVWGWEMDHPENRVSSEGMLMSIVGWPITLCAGMPKE